LLRWKPQDSSAAPNRAETDPWIRVRGWLLYVFVSWILPIPHTFIHCCPTDFDDALVEFVLPEAPSPEEDVFGTAAKELLSTAVKFRVLHAHSSGATFVTQVLAAAPLVATSGDGVWCGGM